MQRFQQSAHQLVQLTLRISFPRFKAVDKSLTEMSVEVIRGQGLDTDVIVYYETRDLSKRVTTKPGVETYRAVVGQDYQRPTTKFIRFAKQEVSIYAIVQFLLSCRRIIAQTTRASLLYVATPERELESLTARL